MSKPMNKNNSNLLAFRHLMVAFSGLFFVIFSGFYFFNAAAKSEAAEKPAAQNLILGKLAFTMLSGTFGAPQSRIRTANADGTGQVTVAGGDFPTFDPSWSPDGTKIAYCFGGLDIFMMNSDGSGKTNISNSQGANEQNPSWSVTNKIAYERSSQIWVMNADGSNQIQFPGITQPAPKTPIWSANGGKLAFVSGGEIWTVNADGTNEQRVTTNATTDTDPSWSPDGTKIVFAKGSSGIAVINADGTSETNLTNDSSDVEPDWSPDGTTIAFHRTGTNPGIYLMNTSGANQVRIIADTPGTSSNFISNNDPVWQPVAAPRPAKFDFDGDARADISVFRPSNGNWYLSRSTAGIAVLQWGIATDVLTPADYDGDQKTDLAVWRPADGNFYILNSLNNTVRVENFGLAGDIPTGGDWDGDGKADVAVYRPGAQSVFYYRASLGNPNGDVTFVPWGISGDKPVVGDYDGDGRTDAAVYRNDTWYIRQSSNGQLSAVNFGLADDILVPADYDADGKTDIAVFRSGVWYQLRSTQGFTAFQFGIAGDIPAPADYDGDGRADAAIYRNGVWWTLKSQSGAAEAILFGAETDKPIPSSFIR